MKTRQPRQILMKTFALGITLLAIVGPILAGGKNNTLQNINVFITTATNVSGFTDPEYQQRSDSVEDLKKRLGKKIHLVSQRDGADVVIEVLSRSEEATGATTTKPTFWEDGVQTKPDMTKVLLVSLSAGDYKVTYKGDSKGKGWGDWGFAADSVARAVESWIANNGAELLARRLAPPVSSLQASEGANAALHSGEGSHDAPADLVSSAKLVVGSQVTAQRWPLCQPGTNTHVLSYAGKQAKVVSIKPSTINIPPSRRR